MFLRTAIAAAIRNSAGVATVEFAYALPLLLVCISGLANVTQRIAIASQVDAAANAGVRQAARSGFDAAKITMALESYQPGSGISAYPAPAIMCRCLSHHGSSTITDCTQKCSDGKDPARYAVVTATVVYQDPFPWFSTSKDSSLTNEKWTRLK